ncbi:class I SAM-dependent methyltransferase [Nonlabens spongiae]|nr:methyltransferase domain-containing protein [Nonlabens spongiae]
MKRRKFQGVLNILSFNRHFYVIGVASLTLLISLVLYFELSTYYTVILVLGFTYGLLVPLIVSAYIYDYSGFYEFRWLDQFDFKDSKNNTIININAGFDETSFIIKDKLPQSNLKVYDFYNPDRHTEPAIVRARKVSNIYPYTQRISSHSLPLKAHTVDYIFLISAIHEIRNNDERITFLKECGRVLKNEGRIIMVEHLRDLPNFLAFTVGFTHFFSSVKWRKSFKTAGFRNINEIKFTPFMSIFEVY